MSQIFPQAEDPAGGSAETLTAALKDRAGQLGFGLVGACPAVTPEGLGHFYQWLAAGYAGEMEYFAARREAYAHPAGVLEGTRSLLVLGFNYRTVEPSPAQAGEGRISRYAWGTDYHLLIRERLHELADYLPRWHRRREFAASSTPRRCWRLILPLGRIGMGRQESVVAESAIRQLVLSGRAVDRRDVGLRPTSRVGPLRHVPGLSRRLSDRCVCRAVCARQSQVHQLFDD